MSVRMTVCMSVWRETWISPHLFRLKVNFLLCRFILHMSIYSVIFCPTVCWPCHKRQKHILCYPWLTLAIPGYPWQSLAILGYPWLSLAILGYPWLSLAIPVDIYNSLSFCCSIEVMFNSQGTRQWFKANMCTETLLCTISMGYFLPLLNLS